MNTPWPQNIHKILVVVPNWIGDCIFAAPVVAALNEYFPKAHLACMGAERTRDIMESIPSVNEVIIYDEKGVQRSWGAKWRFAQALRSKEFDAAILLRPSVSRAMLLAAARIPTRIGYAKKGKSRFLTQAIAEAQGLVHRSDYYLHLLEASGIPVNKRQCVLRVGEQGSERIEKLLRAKGISAREGFIVINPGGNWDLKRWPAQRYAALAQELLRQGKRVVLTGAAKDKDLCRGIAGQSAHERLHDLSGETTLKELMALFQQAALVVSGDSGPLHLASSVGTPVVALFGPTRPEVTAPRGKGRVRLVQKEIGCNLLHCYYLECPNNQCMQAIKIEDVLHEIRKIGN